MTLTTFFVLLTALYLCFYAVLGIALAVFSWKGYAMTWSFAFGWQYLGMGLFCEESSGDWIVLPLPLVGIRVAFADIIPALGLPEPWQYHPTPIHQCSFTMGENPLDPDPIERLEQLERHLETLPGRRNRFKVQVQPLDQSQVSVAIRKAEPPETQSELQELLEEIEHHYHHMGNLDMAAKYVQDYPHHAAAINEWVDELMILAEPPTEEEWEAAEQSAQVFMEEHRDDILASCGDGEEIPPSFETDICVGDWDGKKCPRCGSGTLANLEGRRWCSFVGGAGIPGCTWGLATDEEGEQFVDGFESKSLSGPEATS